MLRLIFVNGSWGYILMRLVAKSASSVAEKIVDGHANIIPRKMAEKACAGAFGILN